MEDPDVASLAVLADAHLCERDHASLAAFEAFLDARVRDTRALVILGDLFEVWVGLGRFEGPHHRRILDRLRRAAAKGLLIHYVEGNRDFLVGALSDTPFASVSRGLGLAVAGHRVWLAHGDLVNTADYPYRVWSALSRSAPVRALAHLVPARTARRLATSLEVRLRATNAAHKAVFPGERVGAYLDRRAAEGYGMVVLGHFHAPHDVHRDDARLLVLPAWMDGGSWLRIDEAGARLLDGPPPVL